uniref:Uncharacterized protein n=1 Tax=Anguilla anguilla TaxID=7936 RepID=A0A0E9SLN7_ANGAN
MQALVRVFYTELCSIWSKRTNNNALNSLFFISTLRYCSVSGLYLGIDSLLSTNLSRENSLQFPTGVTGFAVLQVPTLEIYTDRKKYFFGSSRLAELLIARRTPFPLFPLYGECARSLLQ